MKTKEELNNKFAELTEEKINQVTGGSTDYYLFQPCPKCHVGHLERRSWAGGSYFMCVDERNPNGGCGFEAKG